MAVFDPLLEALSQWSDAGRVATFWLRDDDAVIPTPALERLLTITGRFNIPATLAVIPAGTGEALAGRLAGEADISVAVHGWSHTNYAMRDKKKQELGTDRPMELVLGELHRGFETLRALHPARFVPLLVPPWNRIDASLVPHLRMLGFRALSVYGPEKQAALPLVNTHVDVMDWHGTRGGRDAAELVAEIVARLSDMAEHGGSMGLLTHHLVHDEAVWSFLEGLFAATAGHPACRWVPVSDLID